MSEQEPWTVLRLLEWTTQFFKKQGSDSARLDAEVLLAHARDCSRMDLYLAYADVPGDEQRVAFRELVRRRGEGAPVAQLVGFKEFYSLKFRVDENVLVPRPETEHLIIEAIDVCKAQGLIKEEIQVADVGVGSGVISVTLAKQLPNARVVAIDISQPALEIAQWNAEKHEVADRLTFVHGDLLEASEKPAQFDLICSNPPYISQDEFEDLEDTVREHEPVQALVAGPKGTEVIDRLVDQSVSRLKPGGQLIIELSPMIAEECSALVEATDAFQDTRLIKDLAGHQRILSTRRKVETQ
ncbi:MAG: peptide chain release factor N(5)-glutamine methyltransferase [Planctomycetota bacterium]